MSDVPPPAISPDVPMAPKTADVEPNFFDDLVPASEVAAGHGNEMEHSILKELKSEITLYKLMAPLAIHSDLEKTTFSNPLVWWKALCGRFPLLSRRAQKVLALMGTSAPSERVFSSGGNVVTKNRASMHSDTVANLVLLKQSLLAATAFELKKSQNAAKR